MQKWHQEGIPLSVVLEAIDQVFQKNEESGRRKVISSLSYCRHAVKELWEERRDLQSGAGDAAPEENLPELLEKLAADVESSSAPPEEVTRPLAAAIRALASEKTVPRVEERLIEIEHDFIERVLAALPAEEREAIERPAASIADTALDEKTRRRTVEANLRRAVRDRFSLPRLTLFR